MRKEFYSYLNNLFQEDKRVAILLGDIGVFSFQKSFEFDKSRIYNMGIMEQTMIGVSSALSSKGFIPFVHSIAPFITERCYEQLKLNLGYESQDVFVVSVGNSYDYSGLGVTHHCPNDLRIVSSIPNFRTFCAGNISDVKEIVKDNLGLKYPKYIRLSEFSNNIDKIDISKYNLPNKTGGVVIVLGNAIKNFDKLFKSGVNANFIYTYKVSDFDTRGLKSFFKEHPRTTKNITVVEPCSDSGIISKISLGLENIVKINSISVTNKFIDKYGSKDELDAYLGLDDDSIIERLKKIYN